MKPLVIAHRGASGTEVENSLAAFRAAAPRGADAVELDIHATADGELIVHHDASINGASIAQARLRDLAPLRLPNGEPVPTLAQALDAIGQDLRVFVEVKVLDPRWDERLLETLDRGPNPSGYAVHSFAYHVVRRLGEKRPDLARGLLSEVRTKDPRKSLQDASADTLWQERGTTDQPLVETVHADGYHIIVWTVDEPAEMSRLIAWGVDGICTNFPERGRRAVDASRAA
ncbi:MAG: glycerophosphodiester phosphodiesterase [Gemmatimonadales bacterium]